METTNIVDFARRDGMTDALTDLLRTGAQQLIATAVEAELASYLAQFADLRTECQRRSKIRPLGGAKPGHFGFGRNVRHVAAASQPRLPNSWRLTGRLGPPGPSQRGSFQAVSVDFRARLCARR